MKRTFLTLLMIMSAGLVSAQIGTITNIYPSQRSDGSMLVDIYYDLAGIKPEYNITMEVSFDGGTSFSPAVSVSGDIGFFIAPGTGKHIVWEYGKDFPSQFSAQTRIKLTGEAWECGSIFQDPRDGQLYSTVQIGTQCWFAKNLNTGTMISGSVNQTDNSIIEKYCYDNNVGNCNLFGGLYLWSELMQYVITPGARGICPNGWHVPTDDEQCTLEQFVDPTVNCTITGWLGTDVGLKLKTNGGWALGGNGTNEFGFSALPGGYFEGGSFFFTTQIGSFWLSSLNGSSAWSRYLTSNSDKIDRASQYMSFGSSARCIKDPTPPPWSCGDTIVDQRDGQVYQTVAIGTQCWMKENLNVGGMIAGSSSQSDNGIVEKYCYADNAANCDLYGGLYQWDEMMKYMTTPGVKGICMEGWHVPTDAEFCTLTQYIDPTVSCAGAGWTGTDAGLKMKSTSGWYQGGNGTNASGFTCLPGGIRQSDGTFADLTLFGTFWTSTESSPFCWFNSLAHWSIQLNHNLYSKGGGFSVRCLRN
jgi:uncharacterized protein (TIGR02145 family)